MQFKQPKNDSKYLWTNHVKDKMMYYNISESLIKRIIRFPKRKEAGIAPGTTAVMQPTSNKKNPQEVWVMFKEMQNANPPPTQRLWRAGKNQDDNSKFKIALSAKKKIISAWRYPGVSPIGKKIPIPDEILLELEAVL